MNAKWINQMQYILNNLIERKQCIECQSHWFLFNHEGKESFYRLGMIAPEFCDACRPLDQQLEAHSILTQEQWVEL